ncbi:MAG: hypothetical protein ACO1SV_21835 [Fimbriimonas sp.]
MKSISLWQPWATAIAMEAKRFETRSWPAPAAVVGQRIAIHAAKRWTAEQDSLDCYYHWCGALRHKMGTRQRFRDVLPFGAVVAVATLAEVRTTDSMTVGELNTERHPGGDFIGESYAWDEDSMGDFSVGRFAWRMDDVVRLETPVPCVGRQGFFDLPAEVEAAVLEQVRQHSEARAA